MKCVMEWVPSLPSLAFGDPVICVVALVIRIGIIYRDLPESVVPGHSRVFRVLSVDVTHRGFIQVQCIVVTTRTGEA